MSADILPKVVASALSATAKKLAACPALMSEHNPKSLGALFTASVFATASLTCSRSGKDERFTSDSLAGKRQ